MNGLVDILRSVAQSQGEGYTYANAIADHILKVKINFFLSYFVQKAYWPINILHS